MPKKAMFVGSFDPFHQGHLKILNKALKLFDLIYVVVSYNNEKPTASSLQKRFELVKKKLQNFSNIEVLINQNELTADLAKKLDVQFLLRSARNNFDFQYELELAAGNNSINKDLETILIIPDYQDINYHSRLLKQKGLK